MRQIGHKPGESVSSPLLSFDLKIIIYWMQSKGKSEAKP
jgi:hypothetical protein